MATANIKFAATAGNGGVSSATIANLESQTTRMAMRVAFTADCIKLLSAAGIAAAASVDHALGGVGTAPMSTNFKIAAWLNADATGQVRLRHSASGATGGTLSTAFLTVSQVNALANSDLCVAAVMNDSTGGGRTLDLAINGTNVLTLTGANTIAMPGSSGGGYVYLARRPNTATDIAPAQGGFIAIAVETGTAYSSATVKAAVPTASDAGMLHLHLFGEGTGSSAADSIATQSTPLTLTGQTWLGGGGTVPIVTLLGARSGGRAFALNSFRY